MAYNIELADRVRESLSLVPDIRIEEKKCLVVYHFL